MLLQTSKFVKDKHLNLLLLLLYPEVKLAIRRLNLSSDMLSENILLEITLCHITQSLRTTDLLATKTRLFSLLLF
jgi:hypothetical protein